MLRREGDFVEKKKPMRLGITLTVALGAIVAFAAIGGTGLAGSLAKPVKAQYAPGQYLNPGKVTLCHKQKVTIRVSTRAMPAHAAHGDTVGSCAAAAAKAKAAKASAKAEKAAAKAESAAAKAAAKAEKAAAKAAQAASQATAGNGKAKGKNKERGTKVPGRCARHLLRVSPRSSALVPRRLSAPRPSRRTASA